ncbi:hypothetical protein ACJMK2_036887 [Sinanodonta woodiana]|uniref:Uncharacterized protein n=1 Tax=Sinanodonta woodiana TaxID=1069815 RepID=A0ABD3WM34_SINWO
MTLYSFTYSDRGDAIFVLFHFFNFVSVVAFSIESKPVNEKLQWLRSMHLKDSENNLTVSNNVDAVESIPRAQNATSGLEFLDTVPEIIETLSSTTNRVAEIGDENGEVIEPYQAFTQSRSTLLGYLLTWKGAGLPVTPDSVTSTMSGENNVTNVSGMLTDVISSSDGMLAEHWHRSLNLENQREREMMTVANSEDNSKMHISGEEASEYNETGAQTHILNSIDGTNSTFAFHKSRLHDMISITKFIIVTATVSCAVIVILALIFGISSCRKRKEVTLCDVKADSIQTTDSDLLKVIPHEDKDTFMGIPSNNQIWKELQIIEKSAATPSVNYVEID